MKILIQFIAYIFIVQIAFCQKTNVLSFPEYLAYIKKHHPIVKQANLVISESEAKLLKARGTFDPKLEFDYENKKYKNTEYYDKLKTAFKIPTWYGVELNAGYEENEGVYLNPEEILPTDGLFNLGVSVSLAKDLLINKRVAVLKQAKIYKKQAVADNLLLVNKILFEASKTYFLWLKTYNEKKTYKEFLDNAKLRLQGVVKSYSLGDVPAIDTTEAQITFNQRKLNLEKVNLNYLKSSLAVSNFLWVNDIPIELETNIIPDVETKNNIDNTLQLNNLYSELNLENHPKIKSLTYKYEMLDIERRLNVNNLLPKINLNYNLLSESTNNKNSFNTSNYKAGLSISFPLFLRKERANIKITNYKLQAIDFEKQNLRLELKNKFNAIQQEINSYGRQIEIANIIIGDYAVLLNGEERKFEIGESSLFLINSREAKLIENRLKVIELENLLLNSKSKLFENLGINTL